MPMKPTSKTALWATGVPRSRRRRNRGSAAAGGGASASISSVMPVTRSASGGMEMPGFTRQEKVVQDFVVLESHRAKLGDAVHPGDQAGGLHVEGDDDVLTAHP